MIQENTQPAAAPQGEISKYDQEKMGPQQREQLEDYVLAGYEIIYNEGEAILGVANREGTINKVEDVANALLMTALKIDRSREQNRLPPFPDQVKIIGAYQLNDKVIEFAEHRGAKPFTPEEKKMSFQQGIQKYMTRGIKQGTIDPKDLAVAAERGQPGSITEAMAKLPDDSGTPLREEQRALVQAPQEKAKPPGLLGGQPSPLERFLK